MEVSFFNLSYNLLLSVSFWIGLSNKIKSCGSKTITAISAVTPPLPIADPKTLIAGIVEIILTENPAKVRMNEDVKIAFADIKTASFIAENLSILLRHST